MTEKDRDILRQWLAERDEKCPGCGYSLRGLAGERCPECNAEIRLRVASEPRQGLWIAGLAALAAGVGFNGIALAILLAEGSMGMSLRRIWGELWTLIVGLALTGLGTALWVWNSRRVRSLPRAVRWALVALCAGLTVGFAVLFYRVIT